MLKNYLQREAVTPRWHRRCIQAFGDGARQPGVFDAEVPTADDADIVTKMAGMAGRQY